MTLQLSDGAPHEPTREMCLFGHIARQQCHIAGRVDKAGNALGVLIYFAQGGRVEVG